MRFVEAVGESVVLCVGGTVLLWVGDAVVVTVGGTVVLGLGATVGIMVVANGAVLTEIQSPPKPTPRRYVPAIIVIV
mgnify:CR=1 FL=1